MPISNVDITDTLNFGRQIVNQISSNLNAFLGTQGMTVTGNIHISPASSTTRALNVTTGYIAGNGFNLFSIPTSAITRNTLRNSQLQNSSITVIASTGMNGGGTLALGSSISVNIVPIDSLTSTSTTVAASANSIRWANTVLVSVASDANGVNTGVLATSVGGLGRTTYTTDGEALIGTTEGSLTTNTIRPGVGITASYGAGALSFAANVIQGTNTTIVGQNQISIDAPPVGSLTTLGIVQVNDSFSCTSTTIAATANAVNTVHKAAVVKFASTTQDQSGRLLQISVYSTPGSYTWTKPANTGFIDLVLIGAGGGGAGVGNGIPGASSNATHGTGGFAGALMYSRISNTNLHPTMTVTVGYAGNISGALSRVGYRGGNSSFANTLDATGHAYFANGGNGGLTITMANTANANICVWHKMPNNSGVSMLATGRGPISSAPQPEYIFLISGEGPGPLYKFRAGNVIGSLGGSVPGWCAGGWVSDCGTITHAVSRCGSTAAVAYGPDGGQPTVLGDGVPQHSNGSGFGGGGGGGAYNETPGGTTSAVSVSGGSGANGLCIIKVYSV